MFTLNNTRRNVKCRSLAASVFIMFLYLHKGYYYCKGYYFLRVTANRYITTVEASFEIYVHKLTVDLNFQNADLDFASSRLCSPK